MIDDTKTEGSAESQSVGPSIEIAEIMERLPHRYPFLLIDRCEDYRPGESIIGIKCVSVNEPYFQGKTILFMTLDNVRFRLPVRPGDILKMHVRTLRVRGDIYKFRGEASVNGKAAAEAEWAAILIENPK